jgi:hypothetical protein
MVARRSWLLAGIAVLTALLVPAASPAGQGHRAEHVDLALLALQKPQLGRAGASLALTSNSGAGPYCEAGSTSYLQRGPWDVTKLGAGDSYTLDSGAAFTGCGCVTDPDLGGAVPDGGNCEETPRVLGTGRRADRLSLCGTGGCGRRASLPDAAGRGNEALRIPDRVQGHGGQARASGRRALHARPVRLPGRDPRGYRDERDHARVGAWEESRPAAASGAGRPPARSAREASAAAGTARASGRLGPAGPRPPTERPPAVGARRRRRVLLGPVLSFPLPLRTAGQRTARCTSRPARTSGGSRRRTRRHSGPRTTRQPESSPTRRAGPGVARRSGLSR